MFRFTAFKNIISKSEFTKNTSVLIFGTILAQTIPLLFHPLLRRIYTPEDFGSFAIYFNIIGIITIISTLRYDAAIVLPKNDIEATNILSLSFIINFVLCFCIFLFILLFKNKLCSLINLPVKNSNFLYFLPISALLFSFYQSINFWLIRQKAFKSSSINKISRRSVEGVFQLGLGYIKNSSGLVIGDILGNLTNFISGTIQIKKNNFNLNHISKKKIFYVLKKYKEFPLYFFFPTLLSSIANFLPFFIVNKIYSPTEVGYLDLSRMVLSIPLVFIAASISQVFFQQTTNKKNNGLSIRKETINIMYILITVIVIEFLGVFSCGPQLFKIIFGERYGISGYFSQILIFSFTFNFISSTFSSCYITFGKIRFTSIWQIGYFCAICSLFFFRNLTLFEFLKVYVLIEIIMHSINFIMLYNIVSKYEKSLKLLTD